MIRFYFDDHGQDFLWWDVEDNGHGVGKIVDAGPFQASLWADGKHHDNLLEPHGVGDRLIITDDLGRSMREGHCLRLKYPVVRVQLDDDCIIERAEEQAGAA